MPLSEQAKKNKTRYKNEYARTHYKRIPLDVSLDEYDKIKAAASACNETVNGYIKKAINARFDSCEA